MAVAKKKKVAKKAAVAAVAAAAPAAPKKAKKKPVKKVAKKAAKKILILICTKRFAMPECMKPKAKCSKPSAVYCTLLNLF